jgi:hypothetical protein
MQPSWLVSPRAKRRYRLIVRLIVRLMVGLIVGLIVGLDDIEPIESFKISMSHEVRREIFKNLKLWLIFWLYSG